jgi:hypothetical protein
MHNDDRESEPGHLKAGGNGEIVALARPAHGADAVTRPHIVYLDHLNVANQSSNHDGVGIHGTKYQRIMSEGSAGEKEITLASAGSKMAGRRRGPRWPPALLHLLHTRAKQHGSVAHNDNNMLM